MPEDTRLGVWKRSTGFEVVHPYRRGYRFWVPVIVFLAALVALALGIYAMLPIGSDTAREVLVILTAAVFVAFIGVVLHQVRETHHTRVRIDITPRSLAISRVSPSGSSVRITGFPLERVEAILIDGLRGICVESANDGHSHHWFGQGLRVPDLYYLALVLTKAMDSPERNATNPNILLEP
jgi:hypothetical protein